MVTTRTMIMTTEEEDFKEVEGGNANQWLVKGWRKFQSLNEGGRRLGFNEDYY